jgi:hypothetical protein
VTPINAVLWLFLAIFTATAIIELASLLRLVTIEHSYQKRLFTLLILEVIGAVFALGTAAIRMYSADLVPCASATGWPTGTWLVSGQVTKAETRQKEMERVIAQVTLDTDAHGTTQTDEPNSQATVIANHPLQAGRAIHFDGRAEGYTWTIDGVISTDGCRLRDAHWSDSQQKAGTMTWIWAGRDVFYVNR